jgi:hypothetical protein
MGLAHNKSNIMSLKIGEMQARSFPTPSPAPGYLSRPPDVLCLFHLQESLHLYGLRLPLLAHQGHGIANVPYPPQRFQHDPEGQRRLLPVQSLGKRHHLSRVYGVLFFLLYLFILCN